MFVGSGPTLATNLSNISNVSFSQYSTSYLVLVQSHEIIRKLAFRAITKYKLSVKQKRPRKNINTSVADLIAGKVQT